MLMIAKRMCLLATSQGLLTITGHSGIVRRSRPQMTRVTNRREMVHAIYVVAEIRMVGSASRETVLASGLRRRSGSRSLFAVWYVLPWTSC